MVDEVEALVWIVKQPGWLGLVGFVFGAVVGSFLNVVIRRLPLDQSIVYPSSHCPACETAIRPWDNVPLLSWLWLRGKCRSCAGTISPRYPAVEVLTAVLFAGIALRFGVTFETLIFVVFASALIVAGLVDVDHQIIPDEVSLGGLGFGLVAMPLCLTAEGATLVEAFWFSWLGALLGAGMLWIVGFGHARLSVALGREFEHWPGEGEAMPTPAEPDYWMWFPGMGFGDIKLLAMVGSFLGPVGVVTTVLLASVLGLMLGVMWAIATRTWNSPFGFGPAISGAALLALFVPQPLAWLA